MSRRFKDTRVSVDTTRLTDQEETRGGITLCTRMRDKSRKNIRDTVRPGAREDLWRTMRRQRVPEWRETHKKCDRAFSRRSSRIF